MGADYLIIAEMVTQAHGRVQFVSHGNGCVALGSDGYAIPRASWSASMQAVVGSWPREMVYWEKKLEEYRERGYP